MRLLISIIIPVFLFSCKKQGTVACFAEPTGVLEVNEPIKFEDCSVNANEYEYKFGDENSSNEPSPEHTFTWEGDFTVSLKVKGDKNEDQLKRTITIVKIPLTNLVQGDFQGSYVETFVT